MRSRLLSVVLATLLVASATLLLTRAQPAHPTAAAGPPLKVVTTITPIADLVKNVGGDQVYATSLVPAGAEPEDYDPTPADATTVGKARIYFANGLGLEDYLTQLVQNAGNPQLEVVTLSDGLPTLKGFGQGADEGGNPHLWLNPRNAIAYVDRIRQTLDRVDPPNAPIYDANAAAYTAALNGLDTSIEQKVGALPADQRVLVSTHDAYPYFADRYGFRYLTVISANPGSDPSAQEYAALVKTVRDNQVKAVFGEAGFSDRFISQLAADTGATYVADLYTDTLSEGPPAATYVDMMAYDADRIVAALK